MVKGEVSDTLKGLSEEEIKNLSNETVEKMMAHFDEILPFLRKQKEVQELKTEIEELSLREEVAFVRRGQLHNQMAEESSKKKSSNDEGKEVEQ